MQALPLKSPSEERSRERIDAYIDLLDFVTLGLDNSDIGKSRCIDALAIVLRRFSPRIPQLFLLNDTVNEFYDLCEATRKASTTRCLANAYLPTLTSCRGSCYPPNIRKAGYAAILSLSAYHSNALFHRNADALCQLF